MNRSLTRWLQICLLNLLIVAFLGIVLRYKIAFSLPFVDQKYLLHGHSHFAFSGWVTQALMVLLVAYLRDEGRAAVFKEYRLLLYANLITAYGMLFGFLLQGYGIYSLVFSTLSIIVSCIFAIKYWRHLKRLPACGVSHLWFKSAVAFNAFSSLGVFGLAFMMATKNIHPNAWLGSIYFYLHFQYNGWFFFACMGLVCSQLSRYGIEDKKLKPVFLLFFLACIPAYLLSVLWLSLPAWVYVIIVMAVFMQMAAWLMMLQLVKRKISIIKESIPKTAAKIVLLSAIALSIKLCLQAGSVIPSLSRLAFGFRPVVIGYLHLVLLGIISLFISGYILAVNYIAVTKTLTAGLAVFASGIVLNEILLATQGIAGMNYSGVPFINVLLLSVAFVLFAGILVVNTGISKKAAAGIKKQQY